METKAFIATLIVLVTYLSCTEGIICLTCSTGSERDCKLKGIFEECPLGEICSTTLQRNGFQTYITKQCKQRNACLNEQNQNWQSIGQNSHVCNKNRRESMCRCCCFSDYCNKNERCAENIIRSDVTTCPQLVEPFPNGRRRCTGANSNRVGSVCNFRCNSNYQVNPRYSQQITCLPNGKWNKPVPCCSKPCPPNLYLDLIFVSYYKDHLLLQELVRTHFSAFMRTVAIGPDSLRMARLHYDSIVHTPYLGFRDTANLTSEEVINLTIEEVLEELTNQSIVNTGAALLHVFNNEFNTQFDRPNARNVIMAFSDDNPQDDVATAGKLLRENGVTIYPYLSKSDQPPALNEKQFYAMSGFHDRRRILPPDRIVVDDLFYENFCYDLCRI